MEMWVVEKIGFCGETWEGIEFKFIGCFDSLKKATECVARHFAKSDCLTMEKEVNAEDDINYTFDNRQSYNIFKVKMNEEMT